MSMVESINEPHTPSDDWIGPDSINEPPIEQVALTITSISPDTEIAGSPPFDMTLTGTGFSVGSVVYFGSNTPDCVFDGENLVATIDISLLSSGGVMPVTVRDSGETSNAVDFTIIDPTGRA